MRDPYVIALALSISMLGACASAPKGKDGEAGAPPRVQRQTDQLCMSDCMGNGGNAEFCSDRCTN